MESSQLNKIAAEIAAATADHATHGHLRPLSSYLLEVREVLGMDIAFVSEFVDDRRVFAVVSASGEKPLIEPGASHPLLDTYCQRIVSGELPRLIPDTASEPGAAKLPVTRELRIGAYLSAPIVLRNGKVFGTLCCLSHVTRPDLRQSDADALEAVANAIALSVDRYKGLSPHLTLG